MSGIAFVLVACFLWAIDTLIRYPLIESGLSPLHIVTYEHIILLLIFSYFLIKKVKTMGELRLSHIFYFFIVGGLGSAIATLCFTRAFTYLNPSLVILLQKFQPLVAIILAKLVLKEPIQKKFIFWALICLFGGLLIGHQDVEALFGNSSIELSEQNGFGYLFAFIAIIGWGASTVFGKKLSLSGYTEIEIMSGRFFFGALVLIPFFFSYSQEYSINSEQLFKISMMILISGILAMFFYYQGLKKLSARTCTLAEMFFPFCAVIANWVFLSKSLTPGQILGGLILLLGSSIIQVKQY